MAPIKPKQTLKHNTRHTARAHCAPLSAINDAIRRPQSLTAQSFSPLPLPSPAHCSYFVAAAPSLLSALLVFVITKSPHLLRLLRLTPALELIQYILFTDRFHHINKYSCHIR